MSRERIGKYRIDGELGQGGMGKVYKGYDSALERHVAIKVMHTDAGVLDELRERFLREARSAARLQHPNIVAVYDLGEESGELFIVMEYLGGRDLREFIKKREFIPFEKKLELIAQICRGLHFAHLNGVVHRDIKPGNIRVTDEGVAKIMDFGLARLTSSELTRPGAAMGTADYMSPEQVRGERDIDARSDLYSAGVILYELVTFRKPFEGETLPSILLHIISDPPPPLSRTLPGTSRRLEEIVERALAKERSARFATGEELAQALAGLQRDLPAIRQALSREVQGLQAELSSLQDELSDRFLTGFLDAELFRLPVPAGDPEDYNNLLLRHASLIDRLALVEERRESASRFSDLIERARRQLQDGEAEACLATLHEVLLLHPASAEAQRLLQEARRLSEERRQAAAEAERRRRSAEEEAERRRRSVEEGARERREREEVARVRNAAEQEEERRLAVDEEERRLKAARAGRRPRREASRSGSGELPPTAPLDLSEVEATRALGHKGDGEGERTEALDAREAATRAMPASGGAALPAARPLPPVRPAATPPAAPALAAAPAAGPRRKPAAMVLAAAAALLVGAVLVLWLRPRPTAPAGLAGAIYLNVAPWGEVESVRRLPGEEEVDVGAATTPCLLSLPAGRYRIGIRSPLFQRLDLEVEVKAGVTERVHGMLPGFDLERELDAVLSGMEGPR